MPIQIAVQPVVKEIRGQSFALPMDAYDAFSGRLE